MPNPCRAVVIYMPVWLATTDLADEVSSLISAEDLMKQQMGLVAIDCPFKPIFYDSNTTGENVERGQWFPVEDLPEVRNVGDIQNSERYDFLFESILSALLQTTLFVSYDNACQMACGCRCHEATWAKM
ncbi:hypothetical protein B0H17DRAFT_1195155 [Mycena rosella]|uniref:Uncharacterized protein n=1 Tax=Mycena rosella TaxID=1033263 RepID=A0AAD7GMG3_MYCRO|nr:hypothetical protein B0H17DRAFT_1195155 [Mycena rosella]